MPTLVIDNVPEVLIDRIQRLAKEQHNTPSEVAVRLLEEYLAEPPLRNGIFSTPEISAPCDIPRPEGRLLAPSEIHFVEDYVPQPHDIDVPSPN